MCYLERNNRWECRDKTDKWLVGRLRSLKLRCTNEGTNGYKNYQNVCIHQEWLDNPLIFCDYMKALEGCDPTRSIDRIDNNKGYVPGNVRWATPKQQAFNRRTTIKIRWNNEDMALQNFIRDYTDLSRTQGVALYKSGLSLEELNVYKPRGRIRCPRRRA